MAPSRFDSLLSRRQILSIAQANARINLWDGAIRSGKTISSLLRWLMYVANASPQGELLVVAKTSITASRNVFGPLTDYELFGELSGETSYTAGAPSAMILGRKVWVIGANDARAETRLRGLTCAGRGGRRGRARGPQPGRPVLRSTGEARHRPPQGGAVAGSADVHALPDVRRPPVRRRYVALAGGGVGVKLNLHGAAFGRMVRVNGRCACRKVTSRVDGRTYRLSAVTNDGQPSACLAHGRTDEERRLAALQRRHNRPRRRGRR